MPSGTGGYSGSDIGVPGKTFGFARVGTSLPNWLKSVSGGVGEVRQQMSSWGRQLRENRADLAGVGREASGLTSAIGGLAPAILASIGAFKIWGKLKEVTLLAARVEVLDVVVKRVGETAGYSARQLDDVVERVKAMGITTQAARIAVTRMIWAELDLAKATQLARVAQDAAVIANINSSFTLQQLIYGIVTYNPRILRTYGIMINMERAIAKFAQQMHISTEEVTVGQKQQIALNEVLSFGAKITGAYETAMTKAGKQWVSMPRYIEEAYRVIGEKFLPAFSLAVVSMTKFWESLQKSKDVQKTFYEFGQIAYVTIQGIVTALTFLASHWRQAMFFVVAMGMVKVAAIVSKSGIAIKAALLGTTGSWVRMLQLATMLLTVLLSLPKTVRAVAIALTLLATGWLAVNKLIVAATASTIGWGYAAKAATGSMIALRASMASIPWVGIIALAASALLTLLLPALYKTSMAGTKFKRVQDEITDSSTQLKKSILEETRVATQAGIAFTQAWEDFSAGKVTLGAVTESFEQIKKLMPDLIGPTDTIAEAYKKVADVLQNELIPRYRDLQKAALDVLRLTITTDLAVQKKKTEELVGELKKEATVVGDICDVQKTLSYMRKNFYQTEVDAEGNATELGQHRLRMTKDLARADTQYKDQILQGIDEIYKMVTGPIPEGYTLNQWYDLSEEKIGKLADSAGNYTQLWEQDLPKALSDVIGYYDPLVYMSDEIKKKFKDYHDQLILSNKEGLIPALNGFKEIIRLGRERQSNLEQTTELLGKNAGLAGNEYDKMADLNKDEKQRLRDMQKETELGRAKLLYDKYSQEAAQRYIESKYKLLDLNDQLIEAENTLKLARGASTTTESLAPYEEKVKTISDRIVNEERTRDLEIQNIWKEEKEEFYKTEDEKAKAHIEALIAASKADYSYAQTWKKINKGRYDQYIVMETERAKKSRAATKEALERELDFYYKYYDSIEEEYRPHYENLKTELANIYKMENEAANQAYEAWKKTHQGIVKSFQGMATILEAGYGSMVETFIDLEMTGKRRREQIWNSMRAAFVRVLGQMVRDLLLKKLLLPFMTSLFGGGIGGKFFGELFGGGGGMQKGGYAGEGPVGQPAGVFHKREWIVPAEGTQYPFNQMLLKLMTQGQDLGRAFRQLSTPTASLVSTGPDSNYYKHMRRLAEKTEANTRLPIAVKTHVGVDNEGLYVATQAGKSKQRAVQVS